VLVQSQVMSWQHIITDRKRMIEIQAPNPSPEKTMLSVFLAGSIEMGAAENWQTRIVNECKDDRVIFYNPRRDDWDSSWKQTKDDPQFSEQVRWELDHLEKADLIVMYFDPNTKSPITLLELGIHAQGAAMIVCCPEGFYRKGNVDIVCDRYGIAQVETLDEIIHRIKMAQ